jgi:hypothetical protein
MSKNDPLEEFWAVTQGGIYHVTVEKTPEGTPTVEKIQSFRQNRDAPLGGHLTGGSTVAITVIGIFLYNQGGRSRQPQDVNITAWGGGTSQIVGLFLSLEKATAAAANKPPLNIHDPRWQKETFEVLDAIGNNHPFFVVSTDRSLSLRTAYK